MADNEGGASPGRHLDATGSREVVFCHQCEGEWYRDEHGLICPTCEGEITEIITPESDPRPILEPPSPPPGFAALRGHQPWRTGGPPGSYIHDDSDPEEADIEEHITHGPQGTFVHRTVRRSTPFGNQRGSPRPRHPLPDEDPDHVLSDFQRMLGGLMGPQFQQGQTGRSGLDDLFAPPGGNVGNGNGFFVHGGNNGESRVMGGRFTFTSTTNNGRRETGGAHQQPPNLATYDLPPQRPSLVIVSIRAPPDQLPRMLDGLFGPMGNDPGRENVHAHGQGPPGLANLQMLFRSMLDPANARSGDAVYTQEALDQIISTLMEQHPTSNAPGPASTEAIAALPKKKLDEELLGPEGKGECSVCMDDVHIGDEVVSLPCSHWFHETCASAWLSEHNTCPICRKGIEGETPPPNSRRTSQGGPAPTSREFPHRRLSAARPFLGRDEMISSRNAARLDAIRNTGGLPPNGERGREHGSRRWQVIGSGDTTPNRHIFVTNRDDPAASGSFTPSRRPSVIPGSRSVSQRELDRASDTNFTDQREARPRPPSQNSGGSGNLMTWLRDRLGGRRQD